MQTGQTNLDKSKSNMHINYMKFVRHCDFIIKTAHSNRMCRFIVYILVIAALSSRVCVLVWVLKTSKDCFSYVILSLMFTELHRNQWNSPACIKTCQLVLYDEKIPTTIAAAHDRQLNIPYSDPKWQQLYHQPLITSWSRWILIGVVVYQLEKIALKVISMISFLYVIVIAIASVCGNALQITWVT